jgi:hypothetical protein
VTLVEPQTLGLEGRGGYPPEFSFLAANVWNRRAVDVGRKDFPIKQETVTRPWKG